jgi:hypothetical protein
MNSVVFVEKHKLFLEYGALEILRACASVLGAPFLEPLIVSGRLNPGTLQKEPCRESSALSSYLWCTWSFFQSTMASLLCEYIVKLSCLNNNISTASGLLLRRNPRILKVPPYLYLLCVVVGVAWLLVLPLNDYSRTTYISENALLPGQVHTYFAGSDQNIFRGDKHEVDALGEKNNIEYEK